MKGPFTQYERELYRDKPVWRLLPLILLFISLFSFFIFYLPTALLVSLACLCVGVLRPFWLMFQRTNEAEKTDSYHPTFLEALQNLRPFNTEEHHDMALKSSWLVQSVKGYGSGFLWQPNILITCKHCVDDINLMYAVNPASKRVCRIKRAATHPEYDIAILELEDHNIVYESVKLAEHNAEVDDPIWVYKHLTALSYAKLLMNSTLPSGELTKWASIQGAAGSVEAFHPDQQKTLINIIGGMSGSAVFNPEGEVIGMVTARNHHYSVMLPVEIIRNALKNCYFTKNLV